MIKKTELHRYQQMNVFYWKKLAHVLLTSSFSGLVIFAHRITSFLTSFNFVSLK